VSAGGIGRAGPEGGDMPDGDEAGGGGLSGGGAGRAAALERRYRRLLRCYPPGHREVHREEMLGVLLAAARPGQRVPGAWQAVNLVACGVAIRARRALSGLAGEPWQDALAVVSLIAPVLMLVIAALDFATWVRQAVAGHQIGPVAGPFWQLSLVPELGGPAAVMLGWLAVVVLGLAGRRRAAAAVASVPLALALVNLLAEVMQLSGAWSGGLPMFLWTAGLVAPVVLASLAACSLAFSAGPRTGLAIAGRRRACLMIAGLSAGFGFPAIVVLVSPSTSLAAPVFSLLGVLAIAVAVVVTRVRGTAGRRVAVPLAAGLLLNLASTFPLVGDQTAFVVVLLASLLFAVLAWPVAIASWRERVPPPSSAAGG
jgi:hypothetical protein